MFAVYCLFSFYVFPQILQLRFPGDQRVGLVKRFLQSVSPVRIALTQKPEVRWPTAVEKRIACVINICAYHS